MADDGIARIIVLLDELFRPGKGYLVDVLFHFLGRHADTLVGNGQRACLFVSLDTYLQVFQAFLEHARGGKGLQLLRGIHRVRDQLAQEYLMVGIQKLLDDGKQVLRGYAYFSFAHDFGFRLTRPDSSNIRAKKENLLF